MAKIYLASSWRNTMQQTLVKMLRENGHEVYDFKNPPHGNGGFQWTDIDKNWMTWTSIDYIKALKTPIAENGFNSDFDGMKWADIGICLLPSGRSAHLEIGWMAGAGKKTCILTSDGQEPELMAKLCDHVFNSYTNMLDWINGT